MADLMAVDVVTPEETLITGPAARVSLRTSDGSMTVLPGHAPFIGYVLPGPVTVEALVMTAGATVGYFAASHYAQRIPQAAVRHIAAAIGLAISGWLLWKQFA